TATRNEHYTATHATEPVLCLAFALSAKTWKLGCTTGHGQTPRERSSAARHQVPWLPEVAPATRRVGLPATAPVVRCDAAGRAGCWRHRFFQAHGITTQVVDSSAIAVKRRQRRAKSDAVDVRTLLRRLRRSSHGARQGWRVGHVPSVDAAEQRHVPRDLEPRK